MNSRPPEPTNFNPEALLTPAECQAVDSALLPYRDKFATRLTIYALRTLQPLAQELGIPLGELPREAIATWVAAQPQLHQDADQASSFADWYAQILDAARRPLAQIATAAGVPPEDLTVSQIIAWFEAKAKAEMGVN
jgi:hypothetical protein